MSIIIAYLETKFVLSLEFETQVWNKYFLVKIVIEEYVHRIKHLNIKSNQSRFTSACSYE